MNRKAERAPFSISGFNNESVSFFGTFVTGNAIFHFLFMKKNRPRIKIRRTPLDFLIELLCFAALLALVLPPAWYFPHLPDQLPSHFNGSGVPDAWAQKGSIWIMPLLGLVLYAGLAFMSRYPHLMNYPVTVTAENAEKLYTMATRSLRFLKLLLMVWFAYVNYTTIRIALQQAQQLNSLLIYGFIAALLLLVSFLIVRMALTKPDNPEIRRSTGKT